MKKSLIALAVAGAVSAPAFAATSNVDVYGVLNVALEDTNATGVTPAVQDNTSRIGFKGTEDLGGGLKAVWQIESKLGGNGATMGGGTLADRNTFVGLAGGFGTVLMGRHDTPYKLGTGSLDPFADTIADYNLGRLNSVQLLMNAHDARVGNALAYISPTWSGFHFAVAGVFSNNGTLNNVAVSTDKKTMDAVSATGVYANGPLFASLSYQNVDTLDDAGAPLIVGAGSKAWKLGVGYTFGDAKVGFIYEKADFDTAAATKDRKSWQLNGSYNMGPIVLKAVYGKVSDADFNLTANADQTMWALGLDYNLSKRTAVYFVYGNGDSDAAYNYTGAGVSATGLGQAIKDDISGWNIGVKHSF